MKLHPRTEINVDQMWIRSAMRILCSVPLLFAWECATAQNVFVETLRLGNENGAKRPEYASVLRTLLQKKGLTVVQPDTSTPGEEKLPAKAPAELYVVTNLVLKSSKLDANSICRLMAPSSQGSMTTGAALKDLKGQTTSLKDVTVELTLTKDDLNCNKGDLTGAGVRRIMGEALAPLADQIVALAKKK